MKSKRDIKFIIYQSLYIFVICVIAIKGENLDLIEVEMKKMTSPGWTYIDTTSKIIIDRSEYAQLVKIDTSRYIIISKSEYNNNSEKFSGLQVINTAAGMNNNPDPLLIDEEEFVKKDETEPKKDILIGNIELFQFHVNTINNQGDYPISISGTTIPPHSTGKVTLGSESSVIISTGDLKKTYSVKENKKPQIMFQRMIIMNDEAKVTQLQRNVCYRVTISDDFADQLDVKFSPGVTISSKGNGVYDVMMNAFANRISFDNWAEDRTEPYSIGFTVAVSDKIAPHRISGQQSFVFGEW